MKNLWKLLIVMTVISSCTKNEIVEETTILGVDGRPVSTVTKIDASTYVKKASSEADVAIAEANYKCQERNLYQPMHIPAGLPDHQLTNFLMLENTKLLVSALKQDSNPCPNATNSNDVAIALAKEETERSKTRWKTVPGMLGIIGATAWGINNTNKTADIAIAGIEGAGTIINGNRNSTNRSEQNADNGSTINESGNLNNNDSQDNNSDNSSVSNISQPSESGSESNGSVASELEQSCLDQGGSYRPSTSDDLETVIDADGNVCSDGNGGYL